ncbi:MAG: DUF2169 domain-containing protein [Byssovorax sp.]
MTFERLVHNRTRLTARCLPLDDHHGRDLAVAIAKLTWLVAPDGSAIVAPSPAPVRLFDVPVTPDDPWSGLRYASDIAPPKPGTDVLLIGDAHPPADRGATVQDVSLRVEAGDHTIQKTVRVHGERTFVKSMLGVAPGPAAPRREPVPLIYERSYGGRDESDPAAILIEPRNPAGLGVARDRERLAGTKVPEIEDPRAPLGSRSPAPAGFGPIPSHWAPRGGRYGTPDARWQKERAPIAPLDFDPRHHCVAPDDLWSPSPLTGSEPVEVRGAVPEGIFRFQLPRYAPVFKARVRGVWLDCATHLDTFLIDLRDPSARRVELVWRTGVPIPRKIAQLEMIALLDEGEPLPPPEEDPSHDAWLEEMSRLAQGNPSHEEPA